MSREAERAANEATRDALLSSLAPLPVRARAMFGGFGLYLEDRFFGVIAEGVAYFRADTETRPDYESRGMPPFQPNNRPAGPKTVSRNFRVPPDVLADPAVLREWALKAARARRI